MKSSGQASTEFIIVFSIVAAMLIVIGVMIQRQYAETTDFRLQAAGGRLAKRFAENINEVVIVGRGFSQCFTAPGYVQGVKEYYVELFMKEPTVFINAGDDDSWSGALLTAYGKCRHPICDPVTRTGGVENKVWVANLGDNGICLYASSQGCDKYVDPPTACYT